MLYYTQYYLKNIMALFMCIAICHAKSATVTSSVLMVPPTGFVFNPETAKSNAYQHSLKNVNVTQNALKEFNQMVIKLRENGINVVILNQDKSLPDAVFPNNWFSTHVNDRGENVIILYPMLAPNRREEVNIQPLVSTLEKDKIKIHNIIDLRKKPGILEGTGSMVLDRKNHIIYASLSSRTELVKLHEAAKILQYKLIAFSSVGRENKPIYHTNVMMGLANKYAVICLDCIEDKAQKKALIRSLKDSGKIIIPIDKSQVGHMCGNVIELKNRNNDSLLIMSQQAYDHYKPKQIKQIQQYSKILPMELNTIEVVGGGSARCMIGEIYATK